MHKFIKHSTEYSESKNENECFKYRRNMLIISFAKPQKSVCRKKKQRIKNVPREKGTINTLKIRNDIFSPFD